CYHRQQLDRARVAYKGLTETFILSIRKQDFSVPKIMVYKVSKSGVRSGNTLRGLRSLKSRQYARQACVVGRSNLSGNQVDSLLEESAGDGDIKDTLRNTDVVLSLNKKKRWNLPSAVCHLIKSGHFSKSTAMVSVLERHKLKRRANCVGFACSKQAGGVGLGSPSKQSKQFQPAHNRYFSYSLDHVDQVESRRQTKRRIAEELKTLSKDNKSKAKRVGAKIVNVFTSEGRHLSEVENAGPVYNLEIFYPCPQSCSLTFNPKYTGFKMAQSSEDEVEIKSNTTCVKKSKRKHRERFTKADLYDFNSEATDWEEDVEEMWQEVYEDTDRTDISEPSAEIFEAEKRELYPFSISDNLLAHLIDEAKAAGPRCNQAFIRSRQTHRPIRHGEHLASGGRTSPHWNNSDIKNHLFFIEREAHADPLQKQTGITSLQPSIKKDPVCSSLSIMLSTDDVDPHKLRKRFGNAYAEADCQPRRFCVNITEGVREVLMPRSSLSSKHATYVIFTSAGVKKDSVETYRVTVNCAGCPKPEHLSYSMPHGHTNLDSVINTLVWNLRDLKEAGHLDFCREMSSCSKRPSSHVQQMVMEKLNIQVDTFHTSDELSRASENGNLQEKTGDTEICSPKLIRPVSDSNIEDFCGICYDNVNLSQDDTLMATQLNACGHMFCDTCWKAHLRTRIREGVVHMTCPGYNCKTKLGPSTLLSLLHVTEVSQILQRMCEYEMEICPNAKWCPSPTCGRVIKLTTKFSEMAHAKDPSAEDDLCLDVTCACGERWCFACLSSGHWPASCEQTQIYLEKIRKLKLPRDVPDNESDPIPAATSPARNEAIEMEGRLCPICRRFIDKNGGCKHMTCKCGHEFCWDCLSPFKGNFGVHHCLPVAKKISSFTRIVMVRHLARQTVYNGDLKEAPVQKRAASSRQKASMYSRAIRLRTEAGQEKSMCTATAELISTIGRAAREDLHFKEEVLLQCGFPKSEIPDFEGGSSSARDAMRRLPIADCMNKYLRTTQETRQALLCLVEYMFVLLQDCPASPDKQRACRVASDLGAFCSFAYSVLHAGGSQDPHAAVRRLSDFHARTSRALGALPALVQRLKL
ncbi:hypothetical protein EGW08_000077, partial [Elysia chlorotica]